MQQLFNEERIRSEGQSGVKQKRRLSSGTKPYHADGVAMSSFLQTHDHADYYFTVGIGEFVAVLNGVEFRTRHNDYGLFQPATNNKSYHAVDPIKRPDVPPEVLALPNVKDQVTEMREWFKAFRDADYSVRDYRKYFKPVLCYLEGSWTMPIEDQVDEPYQSDRHFLAATGWLELHRKIRFMSNTGSKDNKENFAFLPTSLIDMQNDTTPIFAQWNYRILCHEPSNYLYRNRMRMVDDLGVRVAYGYNKEKFQVNRGARFQLNMKDSEEFEESHTRGKKYMDTLMAEIPGWDNYGAYLEDNSFGLHAKEIDDVNKALNVAYYHRAYLVTETGANGRQSRDRGFSDDGVYMAMNTQKRVATMNVESDCTRDSNGVKRCNEHYSQKWTYAIPLEIIYLTPLHNWNPYNIEYVQDGRQCSTCKGGNTSETAFQFATRKEFYRTPESFFSGGPDGEDPADSSGESVGMLTKEGHLREVRASGVYIGLPNIKGIGVIRTRYPIAPVHQEGGLAWKELQAMKDMLLQEGGRYDSLRRDYGIDVGSDGEGPSDADVMLRLKAAPADANTGTSLHDHLVRISASEDRKLRDGEDVIVTTYSGNGHNHKLQVRFNVDKPSPYFYRRCDDNDDCWDKHDRYMQIEEV